MPSHDEAWLVLRAQAGSREHLEGMTIEATAAELAVAPGTVKSRLAYGLKQLREAKGVSR